jgi:flavocytochrome c
MKKNGERNGNGISRRTFLKTAGVATAGAGISVGGVLKYPARSEAYQIPEKWDEEADVVVVGFGGAGACAALEAANGGASVLILEKSAVPGGSTALSGGVIYAAGTSLQKKAGIQDSADEMFAYLKACGQGVADDKLMRVCADMSAENVEWLASMGVEYTTELLYVSGMEKEPEYAAVTPPKARGHRCKGTGGAMFNALKQGVKARNIRTLTRTEVVRLVTAPCKHSTCTVLGVKAKKDGKDYYVFARKAVVLSTGGCMISDETRGWFKDYSPDLAACVPAGSTGASADGYRLGMSCGAALSGMNKGALLPAVMPPNAKMAGIVYANIWGLPNIYVDKLGRRFVNESAYYVLVSEEMVKHRAFTAYCIFDSNTVKKAMELVPKGIEKTRTLALGIDPENLEQAIEKRFLWKGETVSELASKMNLDAAALDKTVSTYNEAAGSGKDKDFGREKGLAALSAPPFYGFEIYIGMVAHDGGLKINEKSQVLNTFGEVIPGLYAAGRDSVGLFGGRYPGSGAAISCFVTFGRLAGRHAAAESKRNPVTA